MAATFNSFDPIILCFCAFVQLHDLCAGIHLEERVIARFRRHMNLPVTARSRLGNDGSWKPWEKGRKIAYIPDLKMDLTLMPNNDSGLASEAYVDAGIE